MSSITTFRGRRVKALVEKKIPEEMLEPLEMAQ
jgi:hypothetical protein